MSTLDANGGALLEDALKLNEQYRVTVLLGEGGMGRVYRAEHRLTGQRVAIKALRQEFTADSIFRARFLLEAQVLSHLDHPSITHLVNFIEEVDGRLFLVMQYVAGRTLEELLNQVGGLPPAVAMTLFHHILDAFDYAHTQGIVHRDIKPANIVLPPGGGVKVMDFGIARMESQVRLTNTGTSLGSPAYMSPEQVTGAPVDARADIYALGVLLFEMMTGDIPFPGDNGYTVMKAQVENPPPDPRDKVAMPDAIADGILWALRKRPDDRPSNAMEFAGALPTAEDLGGTDSASWAYVLKDARAAAEVPVGSREKPHESIRPSRIQSRPARAARTLPPTDSWSSAHPTTSLEKPVHVPVYGAAAPPRSSTVPALLATGVLMMAGIVGIGWWARSNSSPSADAIEVLPQPIGAVNPSRSLLPRVIKGAEMVPVPGPSRDRSIYLDRTEVTFRQYQTFLEGCPLGSACGPRELSSTLQLPDAELQKVLDHPVSSVTFNDAEAFCRWAGKRLPSSDEWSFAATEGGNRRFPWGDDPNTAPGWIRQGTPEFFKALKGRPGQLATVSVHDPLYYQDVGPYGVMGLGGNVSEWLLDDDPSDPSLKRVAGGSWSTYDLASEAEGNDRIAKSPESSSNSIGFRCALDGAAARTAGQESQLERLRKQGTVRIGAEQESPPMLWANDKQEMQGFEYALMQHLARSLKLELAIIPGMYPDLPARLRGGHIDLIVSAYTPDSSIRGIDWSDAYLEYGLAMVVKKDSPIASVADLDGKIIGHYNDPATGKALSLLVPRARRVLKYEQRYLEDVKEGGIDAFFYDFPFLQAELNGFLDALRIAQFGLTEATYNVGLAAGEWSLMREVNLAIKEWRSSSAYGELVRAHLSGAPPVTDIPPGARNTLVQPGDTLAAVARRELGDERRWPEIWELNRSRLGNQNLLYVGTPLLLPAK